MQFNLVNDQGQVAQFVWRGVAQRCIAWRQRSLVFWGGACSIHSAGHVLVHVVLSQGVFGQSERSATPLHIRQARAHVLVAFPWLRVRCGGRSCAFKYFPSLLSLFRGVGTSPQQFFSIELTVLCDGSLIWGLGWRERLVAGLRVGQTYGVLQRPGFGLLVSVPRSLSTQPPFATQALNHKLGGTMS